MHGQVCYELCDINLELSIFVPTTTWAMSMLLFLPRTGGCV